MDYEKELKDCKNFDEIFSLVKKAVREALSKSRAGLMLYLADLPLSVGAFHAFGTNGIVLNKKILSLIAKESESTKELNLFVFSLLLHEYLHSLGYLDEKQVRDLTHRIVKEKFGEDRIVLETLKSLKPFSKTPELLEPISSERGMDIVLDFEKEGQKYIS